MSIIIQSGWTKGRGRYAQPQRHHGASQHQERSRSGLAICRHGVVLVRASGHRGTLKTENLRTEVRWPASQFISAMLHPLHGAIADVSSLVGVFAGALSAIGVRPRLFNSFGPYQVARHLLSRLLNSSQEPSCRVTNRFRVLSCALIHAINVLGKGSPCPEKELPKTEKMFPRIA